MLGPVLRRLSRFGGQLSPRDEASKLRHRIDLAGNPTGWDVERILAFKVIGLVCGVVVGLALPLALGGGLAVTAGVTVLLGPLGYFAPDLVLYQTAYNRNERIRRDLPDSMDLLTISVEAGLPFDAALSQVARNTRGPLAEELFRVLQEMQIGLGAHRRACALSPSGRTLPNCAASSRRWCRPTPSASRSRTCCACRPGTCA